MCIYTKFRYLCQCTKFKISAPCSHAGLNSCGQLICTLDPHPHLQDNIFGDGIVRDRSVHTFGVGVCGNVQCQWWFGLLPVGDYGGKSDLSDDAEIDMSADARASREDRWYRGLLTTEQQMDHFEMKYDLPGDDVGSFARLHAGMHTFSPFECGIEELSADHLAWYELNPAYLSAELLQVAVWMRLIPASVIADHGRTLSPLRATKGPFKIGPHVCRTTPGRCQTCGEIVGDAWMKERCLAYQQRVAYRVLHDEALLREDWLHTVAEWDFSTNSWRKVTDPVAGRKYKTIWELDGLLPHVPEPCISYPHNKQLYMLMTEDGEEYDERAGPTPGTVIRVATGLLREYYGHAETGGDRLLGAEQEEEEEEEEELTEILK